MGKKINMMPGERFGSLVTIKKYSLATNKSVLWRCLCDCGNYTKTRQDRLKKGITTSCGCYRKESLRQRMTTHGKSNTKEYKSWMNLKSRCLNKNDKDFKHYGGRGIEVCKKWVESFECFLKDVGICPDINLTIDRINNNGNYEPGNTRWATRAQQVENSRPRNRDDKGCFESICYD